MKNGLKFATLIVLLMLASPAAAAEKASESGPRPAVTPMAAASDIVEFRLIRADSMTLTRQEGKPQVFQGSVDVILVDEDGEETGIKAEKMTIYYEQDLKKVAKIEIEGRVKITRLGAVATTELAVYRGDKNIIELLVDPHVKDSRGELSANKITILLDSDEVVADGDVRGVVYAEALQGASSK